MVCSQSLLFFWISVLFGIGSISLPFIFGIDSPLGILAIVFLLPMSSFGLITYAQHYYKSTTSSKVRTLAFTFWIVVSSVITLFQLPFNTVSSERTLFTIVWCWWLLLIIISLSALLRRSLLSISVHTSSESSGLVDFRKNSQDEEEDAMDEENNENSSLLVGTNSSPMSSKTPPTTSFSWHIFLTPLIVALFSLLIPPFWTDDYNDVNSGWGAFSFVVKFPIPSPFKHGSSSNLSFRYEIWLPLVCVLVVLLNNTRKWSTKVAQTLVLLMLTGLCLMLLLLHGSSENRKWYCNMGPTDCASGWNIWADTEIRWHEIGGRMSGHLLNAVLLVIMVPVPNLPGFHYWLSHLFFVIVLVHVLLLCRTYLYYGDFPGDLWRLWPKFAPTNPTIFAVTCTGLVYLISRLITKLINMTMLSYRAQLGGQVLFYYKMLNVFNWVKKSSELSLILVCCWHAPSCWVASFIGLFFHAYNLVVRTHRSARLTKVITIGNPAGSGGDIRGVLGNLFRLDYSVEKYRGGHGRLPSFLMKINRLLCCSPQPRSSSTPSSIKKSSFHEKPKLWEPWEPINARPGQYVYLNCPEVSLLEWHPAYVSSTPTDPFTSHHLPVHIGGWVDKLASVAALNGQIGKSVILNVDGPYGIDESFGEYERIMIIGGGGGIAPCHAIFRQLHQEALKNTHHSEESRVHLIWIARYECSFEDEFMRSTLEMVNSTSCGGRFSFSLYLTRERPSLKHQSCLAISQGRPDWAPIFRAMGEWEQGQGRSAGGGGAYIYACGPESLLSECTEFAESAGVPASVHSTPMRPGGFSAETTR